jgi:hypothetical protein
MLTIAVIVATILAFIDPIFTIILVVSGILGVIVGGNLVMNFIPDNTHEFLSDFSEMVQKAQNDSLKDTIDNINNN